MNLNNRNSKKCSNKYTLSSILNFGKYRGQTLIETIDDDPKYVSWCLDEIEWFRIDYEAKAYLNEVLSEYGDMLTLNEEDYHGEQ